MPKPHQTAPFPRRVSVPGAGIAGTWQALLFTQAGCAVALYERGDASMAQATSYRAGGMLSPFCEAETAEPVITRLGLRSLDVWRAVMPQTPFNGSLVVAHARDRADFERFCKLTTGHARLDADAIAEQEPNLAGRFREALFFRQEGHVDPRQVLPGLHDMLRAAGAALRFGEAIEPCNLDDLDGLVIDCRGLAARADTCPALRGVKGEIIIVETRDVNLTRPVRLIHPRWSLYIVPRENHRYLIGATSIECEDARVSVRSALELLTAAYTVHPAFGEARIVELGAALRPAFPDHRPRITIGDNRITVNGLYRHGFLLAPALAEATVAYVQRGDVDHEVMQCR
jgi:glycine oxidase